MLHPPDYPTRSWKGAWQQAVILTVLMLLSLSSYLVVLWWRGPHATIKTKIGLDQYIPFRPEWVWVYLFPYAAGPGIAALMSRETFWWYIRRGIVVVLISVTVFAIVPTQTVRPNIQDLGSGPTAQLYRQMIVMDDPAANAAPSLHVSLTCLLGWALLRDFPRGWPVIMAAVGIVWLSTLLTWQHHLIDVATGVLLGLVVGAPFRRMTKSQGPMTKERPSSIA